MEATKKGWKLGGAYYSSRIMAEATIETREIERNLGLK